MCGFVVQLVEQRTGIAEVMGSNPVEALISFGFFTVGQHRFLDEADCNPSLAKNSFASCELCGLIAQLVEHSTVIAEVMGSNPVEALIFSGFFFQIA